MARPQNVGIAVVMVAVVPLLVALALAPEPTFHAAGRVWDHRLLLHVVVWPALVVLAVRIRLERMRTATAFLLLPGEAIARADGAAASTQIELCLGLEPGRVVRQALLLLAEWAALEPHGRRLIESAVLPPETRELLWTVASDGNGTLEQTQPMPPRSSGR